MDMHLLLFLSKLFPQLMIYLRKLLNKLAMLILKAWVNNTVPSLKKKASLIRLQLSKESHLQKLGLSRMMVEMLGLHLLCLLTKTVLNSVKKVSRLEKLLNQISLWM